MPIKFRKIKRRFNKDSPVRIRVDISAKKKIRIKKRQNFKKKSDLMGKLYQSEEYKEWRNQVFSRDKYTCKFCGKKDYIEAHHILRKWDYPELMFNIHNGITLCGPSTNRASCHGSITGREYKVLNKLLGVMDPIQRTHMKIILERKGLL